MSTSKELAAGSPSGAAAAWKTAPAEGHQRATPSSARKIRLHGLLHAAVGGVAGALFTVFGHPRLGIVVWSIAAAVLAAALFSPHGVHARIRAGLVWLSHGVGTVLTWLLFVPLFYVFFAGFGLLFRRGRRDSMTRWFDRDAETYWTRREDAARDQAFYERQY